MPSLYVMSVSPYIRVYAFDFKQDTSSGSLPRTFYLNTAFLSRTHSFTGKLRKQANCLPLATSLFRQKRALIASTVATIQLISLKGSNQSFQVYVTSIQPSKNTLVGNSLYRYFEYTPLKK
jgi:hypothetical protein